VQTGGGSNIEIIMINVVSGELTCKKWHSGETCDSKTETIPRPPVTNAISIATAFTAPIKRKS
jgi:hypothetical protein